MTLTSLVGNLLNPRGLTEKAIHDHFIGTSHVSFTDFKTYIERAVAQNVLATVIDWKRVRAVCWSQCETWHLQNLPFDLPEGHIPQDLYQSLYWLWCTFNQIADTDAYPPSADYEEVELLLRKLFSSLGILWEEYDDNVSSISSSSQSSMQTPIHDQNGFVGSGSMKSSDTGSTNLRLLEDDTLNEGDDYPAAAAETFVVTFPQLLCIISDMLGSETVLSSSFGRAVTQVYLSEVDEIIKTGWMYLKKPGTDSWKKRWVVLRHHNLQFYSDPLCTPLKYQIVMNHKMHVESLPDSSSHKHRFRLVEREGDFNIAWEAEMSCQDSQHCHSWMLVINLTIKIDPTGLSAKKVEIAERRLERHRRRESEISAIEKRKEVYRTRQKLELVKERWNTMQEKLQERAAAREEAMETVQKMDEIYDKLQSIAKKQSLIRKANLRIRSAFPSMSSDSGIEITKDEKTLLKARDDKILEQKEKLNKLESEKIALQEQLLDLQATAILARDSDKTLILVYGPEIEADTTYQMSSKQRSCSVIAPKQITRNYMKKRTHTYNANSPSTLRKATNVPTISISTSVLSGSPSSTISTSSVKLDTTLSQSHPELRNEAISLENGRLGVQAPKTHTMSSLDSAGSSNVSSERLV